MPIIAASKEMMRTVVTSLVQAATEEISVETFLHNDSETKKEDDEAMKEGDDSADDTANGVKSIHSLLSSLTPWNTRSTLLLSHLLLLSPSSSVALFTPLAPSRLLSTAMAPCLRLDASTQVDGSKKLHPYEYGSRMEFIRQLLSTLSVDTVQTMWSEVIQLFERDMTQFLMMVKECMSNTEDAQNADEIFPHLMTQSHQWASTRDTQNEDSKEAKHTRYK